LKWFKHDSDASIDAKLQELLLDYGAAGYGLYWYCLELISQNVSASNITFELDHDARIIARNLNLSIAETKDMMKKMVELGLFDISKNQKLACYAMAKRLDQSMTSNKEMRKIIDSFKGNHDGVMTESIVRHDKVMQEEKRREEKREEEIIVHAKPEKQKSFSFNLTKKAQYDNLSSEYKDRLYAYAVIKDGAYEFQKFIDNHSSKGNTFKDWSRAYNTWISNAIKYSNGKWNPEHHVYKIDNHPEHGTVFKESTGSRIFTDSFDHAGEVTIKVREAELKIHEEVNESDKVMNMISGLGVKI